MAPQITLRPAQTNGPRFQLSEDCYVQVLMNSTAMACHGSKLNLVLVPSDGRAPNGSSVSMMAFSTLVAFLAFSVGFLVAVF